MGFGGFTAQPGEVWIRPSGTLSYADAPPLFSTPRAAVSAVRSTYAHRMGLPAPKTENPARRAKSKRTKNPASKAPKRKRAGRPLREGQRVYHCAKRCR